MIDLTPLEVRQKKGDFRRNFRGYDAELVNDFLDLVADRMEELVKENMALSDRVAALESELVDYREKEAALSDALMAAQKLREDARNHAEKEGELLIREAKAEAEEARQRAAQSLAAEEETLRQVRARRAQLVESFRKLLERELNELAVIEEALELGQTPPASARASQSAAPAAGGDGEAGGGATGSKRDGESSREAEQVDEAAGEAAGSGEGADASDGEDGESGDVQEDWLQSLAGE